MSLRFKGKNVLIIGAGSGIWRATAILFANEGLTIGGSQAGDAGSFVETPCFHFAVRK